MSFTYQPKTAAEIAASALLADGDYPYEVSKASDAPSKTSGKPMITLTLTVFTIDGRTKSVTDYIVPGSAYADKKLFELCAGTGLSEKYQTGQLSALDFEGRNGWCKIGTEKGKEKADGSENFPDKNKVRWYLKEAPGAVKPTDDKKPDPTPAQLANQSGNIDDSDVPF